MKAEAELSVLAQDITRALAEAAVAEWDVNDGTCIEIYLEVIPGIIDEQLKAVRAKNIHKISGPGWTGDRWFVACACGWHADGTQPGIGKLLEQHLNES